MSLMEERKKAAQKLGVSTDHFDKEKTASVKKSAEDRAKLRDEYRKKVRPKTAS